MDILNFRIGLEKPVHNTLEDIFDKANLSEQEKCVYIKNKKHCEYWLLRTKVFYYKSFNPDIPNFIKRFARVLIRLFSENVSGGKTILLKEIFPRNSFIHRVYETKNGIRSTQNSRKIENTYFELEVMSFFLDHGFKIELASNKIKGKKIAEFAAIDKDFRINVEAKQLDVDIILDNIYGDHFVLGIDYRLTPKDRDHGYKKIQKQVEVNYKNAMLKYSHIDESEYFLLFISTGYNLSNMGKYCNEFLTSLPATWESEEHNNFLGLILVEPSNTTFFQNPNSHCKIIEKLEHIEISTYHNYIP